MTKCQSIATVALVVRDYDEAIEFYVSTLGFSLVEDTVLSEAKRWVLVAPPGSGCGTQLLLAKADGDSQLASVGNQTGGRVFLFLETDDCLRDFDEYQAKGVKFLQTPLKQPYGTVAVFQDLYGTKWDMIERSVNITLKLAEEKDLAWVNEEYASTQFQPSNMDHKVLIANCNGVPAGLGRLIQLQDESASGCWELGGIFVKAEFRGKEIARKIVQRLLEIGKEVDNVTTIWCIPFGHLVPFYTTFGLEKVSKCSKVVPSQIKAKLGDCCSTFPENDVQLLKLDLLTVAEDNNLPGAL
jgi:catechol 2,3-dioxygenase-like lactoylglutathione lyase family enzyme